MPGSDVYREKQFTVFVHPSLTCGGEYKSDRRQIVDGEVDLVFIENGELVIVDYKTDRVRDVEELRRHKPQLDFSDFLSGKKSFSRSLLINRFRFRISVFVLNFKSFVI